MSLIILNVDEVRRTLFASGGAFVVHDKEVDIVRFAINSGFADIVLDGQVALRVMYQRPGETEVRAQTLTYYDTDGLHNYYDWQLSQSDLAKNGSLMVALCILDISGGEVSEWHTTPCAVRVLPTIHTDDSDEGDDTITPTVKERVAVLESMIQRVASGAPIVVSSMSAMTDTEQIYVLSTDGKWYYHNGTAWTAGGTYGATATDTTLTQSGIPADAKAVGDALGSVSSTIYTEIKHNLIDWDAEDVQNNATWISDGNTSTTSSQTRSITDFFPVDDGRKLCLNYINRVKFFTAEKTFISAAVGQDALEHILVDVPSTAVYAKAQVPNDRKSTAYIYIYMGEYYEYSAYEDDVASEYIADKKTAGAIAESVTSDITSGNIDLSGAPDNSIPMDAIDGVDVFRWNVVDDSKLLIGFNLNGNTGELLPSGTMSTLIYVTTDYCKVEPSVTYKGTSGVVCGYDANKNFVSKLTEASYHTYTIPSDVRYVRIAEQHQRAWENQNIYFMRDGYGKSFGTVDQYPYDNAFPVLATEDGKKGFRLYMDLEPWRDKRILVIGDSYSAPRTWQAEMCENFSAILDNHAVSGAGWCTGRTKTVHELAEAVTENPDIVIITIGGNDCNDQTIEIGSFVNGTTESDYSDSTLYGAMQKALTYIRNRWTGVPVYIGFTPAGNGLVKSQSKERVSAFIEAMKDVCISYACVYIETRTCGIAYPLVQNDVIFQKYAYDSHPSEEGQHQIARYMTDLMSGYKAARSWYTPSTTISGGMT